MKKILIAFFAASCLLGSCSEEKAGDKTVTQDSIDISSKMIAVGSEGQTADIQVTSSGDWRLAGVCDWAHPSATEGNNGQTVTFTIDPNTIGEPREATFKFFTGSAVVALKVSSELGYFLELLSKPALTIPTEGKTFFVEVKTNIEELNAAFSDIGAEWMHLITKSAAFGTTLLEFRVDECTEYSDRSTLLTISGKEASTQVAVTQAKATLLAVDETPREYDLEAREIEVEVESNVEVAVEIEAEGGWITRLDELSGIINGMLRFSLSEATQTRGGKIKISGGGITRAVAVNQVGAGSTSISIPDAEFCSQLLERKWVTSLGGDQYEVTEAGLAATNLTINSFANEPIFSLEGIEGFVNLETIFLREHGFTRFDISKLKKVSRLTLDTTGPREIILGDNPVESLHFSNFVGLDVDWENVYPESLVVSGTHLKSLTLPAQYEGSPWEDDRLASIDVSGCPALETLNCKRYAGVLKTVYLKTGQTIKNLTITPGAQIVYK